MGFDLAGYLTLELEVLALAERISQGGSCYAVPVTGSGLPDGWFLPAPWRLEMEFEEQQAMVEEDRLLEPAAVDAWRAAAGIPVEGDPLGALTELELAVGSLLSLGSTAGVVYLEDLTHAGIVAHEYAATFVGGRLAAAAGSDILSGRDSAHAFVLRDGAYQAVRPAEVNPVSHCAGLLDERYAAGFLFDGYLPRGTVDHRAPGPGPDELPALRPHPDAAEWARYFPLLR